MVEVTNCEICNKDNIFSLGQHASRSHKDIIQEW
jgi:hypothetical protein